MSQMYYDSQDHLYDELLLIDLLIYAHIMEFRAKNQGHDTNFKGLYVSEEEIDALIQKDTRYNNWVNSSQNMSGEYEKIHEAIKILSSLIKEKITNSSSLLK